MKKNTPVSITTIALFAAFLYFASYAIRQVVAYLQ